MAMERIYVTEPRMVLKGAHQGEKLARCVCFPIDGLKEQYGEGTWSIVFRRPFETDSYIVANQEEVGDYAVWGMDLTDTAIAGEGRVELRYYVDDTICKTDVYAVLILPSLGETGDAPSPYEDIIDTVAEYVNEAKEAVATVPETVAEMQAQLDEAISGVTVDSEVINARVGADATTYSTLKNRLDAENAELKRSLGQTGELIDECHNFVNYNYNFPLNLAPSTNPTSATCIGIVRNNQFVTLNNTVTPGGYVRIRLSYPGDGSAVRYYGSAATIRRIDNGITFESGHKYRLSLYLKSGEAVFTDASSVLTASVYRIGEASTVGTTIEFDERHYIREFTADDSIYNIFLYVNEGSLFTDATYIVLLEDITNSINVDDMVAAPFDETANYSIGDHVLYGGATYIFKHGHDSGVWDSLDAEEIPYLTEDITKRANVVDVPIIGSKKIYPESGQYVNGAKTRSVYAKCYPGFTYIVSRTLYPDRFSVQFATDIPAVGTSYLTNKSDATAKGIVATAPENANYIVVYVLNTAANPSYVGREDEVIQSVTISVFSHGDIMAQNRISELNNTTPSIVELHKQDKAKAEVLKIQRTSSEQYANAELKMLFFTDVHNEIGRVSRAVELMNDWGSGYFDVAVNGGDTTATIYNEEQLSNYDAAVSESDIPILTTVGNHDAYETLGHLTTQSLVYDSITAKVVSHVPSIVQPTDAATNSLNYYYYDKDNIRIIVLDCMYWNANEKTWLESVLADAIANSKAVICVSHYNFVSTAVEYVEGCIWNPKSYGVGGSASYPLNIEAAEAVKTFQDNGGEFIIWLCGHSHGDAIKKLISEYGTQFQLICPAFVNRAGTVFKSNDEYAYNYDCLTYLVVDTNYKIIRGLRIGANINNEGAEYHGFAINYGTGEFLSAY